MTVVADIVAHKSVDVGFGKKSLHIALISKAEVRIVHTKTFGVIVGQIYRRVVIRPQLAETVELLTGIAQAVNKCRVGRHRHVVMIAVEVFDTVFPVAGTVGQNRRMMVNNFDTVLVILIDRKRDKFVDQIKVEHIIPAEMIAENHSKFNFGCSGRWRRGISC